MSDERNPLVSDRHVEFLLYEVLDATALCTLTAFRDHSRDSFDMLLGTIRRLSREVLFPAYKPMDERPAVYREGRVENHPLMHDIHARMKDTGIISATRPVEVGGLQLPRLVGMMAGLYIGAANISVAGYLLLISGAAHLIEAFGSEALKREFMDRMYSGEWTGTMALTEPHAGSSLADVSTTATPQDDGTYRIRGSKIFISGGDHEFADNIVNMTLARIEGAPAGIKGVSLFAVPRKRWSDGRLVSNDVQTAGAIHKIGWRGLPSVVLNYGENNDCHGWLVGEPNRGISYMFQMMNEARILVGAAATATASVAFHESLAYARTRTQGRPLHVRDPRSPQVPIIEHADVRRMLLRQKAIVEGSMALVATTARLQDLSEWAEDADERRRAQLLLDLLTPITKTFPAEKGFESNALAVQIHGGYGYSSEYLVEAWMRDQKLNTLHEGTTGIQGLDLLGRKVVAGGGEALQALQAEMESTLARAERAGVSAVWCQQLRDASALLAELTFGLGAKGMQGDVEGMLLHSADYLELASKIVVGWMWLAMASAASEGLRAGRSDSTEFYQGQLRAAQYWYSTEMTDLQRLAELCRSGEDSYLGMRSDWY